MSKANNASRSIYRTVMKLMTYTLVLPCFVLELILQKWAPYSKKQSGVKQRSSITARKVVLFRHLGRYDVYQKNPNPDQLAHFFLGRSEKRQLLVLKVIYYCLGRRFPATVNSFVLLHIARTQYFDNLIQKSGSEQIVLLGAGMDSRAYRLNLSGKTVYEVDLGTTQQEKISLIKESGLKTSSKNIQYVTTDFNLCTLIQDLEKAGFNRELPTLFIWEGVTYYLTAQDVKNTIAQLFLCKDWRLGFDYTIEEFIKREGPFDTKFTHRFLDKVSQTGEPFVFGINEKVLDSWFQNLSLKIIENYPFPEWVKPFETLTDWSGFTVGQARSYALVGPDANEENFPTIGSENRSVSRILKIPDGNIEYFLREVDPEKLRGTLLFFPGAGRPAQDLEELSACLQKQGYRSLILQYPGVGRSTLFKSSNLYDFADCAYWIAEAEFQHQKLDLIGHAFGNRVARAFGTKYSENTKSITLLAGGGHFPIPRDIKILLISIYLRAIPPFLHNYLVQLLMFSPGVAPSDNWLTGWNFATFISQAKATSATSIAEWRDGGDAPMLIIQGMNDIVAPAECSQILVQENATRVRVEFVSAGHALVTEQLKKISDAISNFLKQA